MWFPLIAVAFFSGRGIVLGDMKTPLGFPDEESCRNRMIEMAHNVPLWAAHFEENTQYTFRAICVPNTNSA